MISNSRPHALQTNEVESGVAASARRGISDPSRVVAWLVSPKHDPPIASVKSAARARADRAKARGRPLRVREYTALTLPSAMATAAQRTRLTRGVGAPGSRPSAGRMRHPLGWDESPEWKDSQGGRSPARRARFMSRCTRSISLPECNVIPRTLGVKGGNRRPWMGRENTDARLTYVGKVPAGRHR